MMNLPDLDDISAAAQLLQAKGLASEMIPSHQRSMFVKTDCKLPGGSYKIRGVEYFASQLSKTSQPIRVLSAGNLALAAALALSQKNIACEAVVPEGISQIKRDKLIAAGASITEKSFAEIWNLVLDEDLRQSQQYLHPFNQHLLTGYASIILELHQAGFTDGALVIPYGLGGLATALAHAIDLTHSRLKLYLCEVDGYAPFTRALQANQSVRGEKLQSFIEAMGTPEVISDVFDYLKTRIAGVIQVTEDAVRQAIVTAHHLNLRIEGAAAASLAAAKYLITQRTVVLLTGENISDSVFHRIISGK